jgi:hypothetical protein
MPFKQNSNIVSNDISTSSNAISIPFVPSVQVLSILIRKKYKKNTVKNYFFQKLAFYISIG